MAFAALGIGVGVRILSYGLAGGAAVILNQYGTSTKEMLTDWLYSKFKPATATATDINDDDVGRDDEGSNAATDINDQQTQEGKAAAEELTMIKEEEEEEEIIEKEVINNKSPFTAPVSEELFKVTEVVEEKEEPTAEALMEVLLIPSPLQNIKEEEHGTSVLMMKTKQDAKKKKEEEEEEEEEEEMMKITQDAKKKKEEEMMEITQDAKKKKEEEEEEEEEEMMKIKQDAKKKEEEEEESLWMRVKELISKISDRAKRGVRGLEEWCCYYLKDPDFWDGKKGRIPRAVIGAVADCLFEAALNGNKGLRSTVFSKTLLRRLYNIFKTVFI